MQMDPSDVVDFGIFIGEENCPLGTVQCQKDCTYADIRSEIVNSTTSLGSICISIHVYHLVG